MHFLAARGAAALGAPGVDADREPAARDPAPAARLADALPVPPVDRAHGAGLVSHLRYHAAVQFYETRPAACGALGARRPAARRPDHEDRRRTPTLADLSPWCSSAGSAEEDARHTTTRSRGADRSSRKWDGGDDRYHHGGRRGQPGPTRRSSTASVAAGDGGAGADEPLELADGIAPEGPIKDRLLLPFLLPVVVHRRGRALRAEHLADLPRRRLHRPRSSSARSSPSPSSWAPRSSPRARGCARRRWR